MFSCSKPECCHAQPRHDKESQEDREEGGDKEEDHCALGDGNVVSVDTGVDVAGGGDHEVEGDEDEDECHDQEPD